MTRKILILIFAVFFSTCHFAAFAQTGTRISEAAGSRTQNIVWFSDPHEINEVRQLLREGNTRIALQVANSFVKRMEAIQGVQALARRYYGLNALCSAFASNGELMKAIDTCNRAIEIYPDHWQAYNNRGTVYYVSRQYDLAMRDYRRAFDIKPDSGEITDIIQHNISLAEANQ